MEESAIETEQILNELVEHVKSGRCILFLGAGIHAPPPEDSNYEYTAEQMPPIGKELAKKLATTFKFKDYYPDESYHDLQRVSLHVETAKAYGRKRLVDELDNLLRKYEEPSPALKMLASIPFRIYVTTNYDMLFETALKTFARKDPFCFVYDPAAREPTRDMNDDPTEKRPLLFKMHGDLDHRDSIVITDEDYIKFVQRMSDKDSIHPVPQTVRYRMLKWPTLFVGYSLRDYNLRLLFRTLRWRIDDVNFPTSYSVDRKPDPLIFKVWQNEKIVSFVSQDIWTFVPWLYNEVHGKDYKDDQST